MAYTSPNIIASGTTFAQHQAGGLSGHLERLIAAQGATADPTAAATATATGGGSTGGSLAAGTYYFAFTEGNGIGETKLSPEGAQLTVASTNIPRFTFPALKTGNSARRLYLGKVNGATGGPYTLYATGITTTTFDASVAVPATSYAVGPPTVNSTGLTFTNAQGIGINTPLSLLRAGERGNLQDLYAYLRVAIANFISGQPVNWEAEMMKLRHCHAAFAALAALCAEVGTLYEANPGTLGNKATGIGTSIGVRTWP